MLTNQNIKANHSIVNFISTAQSDRILNKDLEPAKLERWQNAFKKAAQVIQQEIQTFSLIHGNLAVHSGTGDKLYIATRTTCQCEAFIEGGSPNPCYHRAMHTILTKYTEVKKLVDNK